MVQSVQLNQPTVTLISFALKAGKVVKGFESVQKSINNRTIEIILLDSKISRKTLERVENKIRKSDILIFQTTPNIDWKKNWGIEFHKIIGILKGEFGKSLRKNFKAGV